MTVFEILYLAFAGGLFFELFRGELKRREHRKLLEAQRAGEEECQLIQDIKRVRATPVYRKACREGLLECRRCRSETVHRPLEPAIWLCTLCAGVREIGYPGSAEPLPVSQKPPPPPRMHAVDQRRYL